MTEQNYTGILQMGNDDDYIFSVSTDDSYTINVSDINVSDVTLSTIDTSTFDDLITLDGDHGITLTLNDPVDFVDQMPSLDKIKDMCQHYPGLEKAFKNFESVYKMVHQDYKGNHEPKIEVPF